MSNAIIAYVGWTATLVSVALAFWKGGAPERVGATLMLGVMLLSLAIEYLLPIPRPLAAILHLANDCLLAIGFLIAALRFGRLWLGGAMLFQAIQFSLHAFYFVMERAVDDMYRTVNNVNAAGVLICFFVGIFGAWRLRSAKAAKPA